MNKPQPEVNVNLIINIFNYCRYASYSELAFHCYYTAILCILRNAESVFVQVG